MLIDLQIHSNFSDGFLSPKELVKKLKKEGVKVASLTDHNSISGWDEFQREAKKVGLKAIPGLEIYIQFKKKKINILWYNFDIKNEALQKILKSSRQHRVLSVRKSLEKLKRRGFKIDVDKIITGFNDYIPVNRLGTKIAENPFNYRKIVAELIEKRGRDKVILPLREEDILGELFFNKKYGSLSESYVDYQRILKIKKQVGGQIVFCHPGKHNKFSNNATEKLKDAGLIDGIEVLSPHHPLGAIMYAQFLSEKFDLIATGGSDFHLAEGREALIQSSNDWFRIDSSKLRRIREIIG